MLSDAEVVCTFMELKPMPIAGFKRVYAAGAKWWAYREDEWEPAALTLDALHEVEARLTESQWKAYGENVVRETTAGYWPRNLLHASAEEKIRALATVLRATVEPKGEADA